MSLKLTNNATSMLSTSIDTIATALAITAGDEGNFPTLLPGDWCPIVVVDASANREIMRCTARAGVNLTVVRAQEGTAARAFTAGARVDVRLTVQAINEMNADPTLLAPPGTIADSVLPERLQPVVHYAPSNDADLVTVSGRYSTTVATLNIPSPAEIGYLWADVLDPTNTAQYQEWQDYDSTKRWARRKVMNVWGDWYKIASEIPPGAIIDYAGFGPTAPPGYLFPYGQAVSVASFADLTAAIYCGDALNPTALHGYRCTSSSNPNGTRSTTGQFIILPDYRGRIGAGKDNMGGTSANRLTAPAGTANGINGDIMGAVGGSEVHALTEAQLAQHNHDVSPGGSHTHAIHAVIGGAGTLSGIARVSGNGGSPVDLANAALTDGIHTHAMANAGGNAAHNNVQPTIVVNKLIKT